jgi:hypothetical protein
MSIGDILKGLLTAIFTAYVEYKKTQGMKDDEARKQALIDAAGGDKASLKAFHKMFKDAGAYK